MSSNYQELMAQKEALDVQIQAAHERESVAALETIHRLMSDYGLTVDDIAGAQRTRRKLGPVPPKYRDPKTGATWSGRGRMPAWLGSNPKRFLIKE